MVKKAFPILFFLLVSSFLQAADFYKAGLKDYREGRKEQAVLNLKKALDEDPANDGACLYLGVLYQNMGNTNMAEDYYAQGRFINGLNYKDLSFNLANLYLNQKRFEEAEPLYAKLILSPGIHRTNSLLNLANMSVQTAEYERAVDLYLEYLLEDPETSQRTNIEQMISLLQRTIDTKEQQRLAEEERIRQAEETARQQELSEQDRLAEEARQREIAEQQRLEEEVRQKELLDSILNSLGSSGQETKNFTADSEKVEEDFGESDLDD
jgi:tetratricopeptide (TPR) repeat protein